MNNKLTLIAILIIVALGVTLSFFAFYNNVNFKSEIQTSNNLFTQKNNDKELLFTFIVISDTHLNSDPYKYLATYIRDSKPSFLIHLGDHTNFGTIKELQFSKDLIDSLKISYYTLAGDHDIAETSSMENFNKVFSLPSPLRVNEVKIAFLNNPFNVVPFKSKELADIIEDTYDADIILSSQPIYVDKDNFFSYKFMGSQENINNLSPTNQSLLKIYSNQSKDILNAIRNSKKKKLIIGGDHHRSSTYTDPINNQITYHVVGALSKSIYLGSKEIPQKSLQAQRFSVISVLKNDNNIEFNITEQLIEN